MDNTQPFASDAVEQFLDAPLPLSENAELRQSLRLQTTRVLRRRKRFKQVGYAAVLAACYLAGLATMQLRLSMPAPRVAEEMAQHGPDTVPPAAPTTSPPETAALPIDNDPDVPAVVFERVAVVWADKRPDLYRRAGDRYEREGDYQAALRCYTRFLETSSENERAISADDTWLLMSLKKDRQREKDYVHTNG
jgi:hypothetical protein